MSIFVWPPLRLTVHACPDVSSINDLIDFFSCRSEGLPAGEERPADGERDPWPLPQIQGNLPESANPARIRGSFKNMW